MNSHDAKMIFLKPVHFRVYPQEHKRLWFEAWVFGTKRDMVWFAKYVAGRCGSQGVSSNGEAYAITYHTREKKFRNKIGDILFYKGYCNDGAVVHELMHVISWSAKRLGIDMANIREQKQNERLAYTMGRCAWMFWIRLKEIGDARRRKAR